MRKQVAKVDKECETSVMQVCCKANKAEAGQLALWAAGSTWAQLSVGSCCRLAHVEHVLPIIEADQHMYRARAPETATANGSIASLQMSAVCIMIS